MPKAYHINVATLEITDCEVKDYTDLYPLIGNDCNAFDCVRIDDKGTTLFVDDEGLMKVNHLFYIKTPFGEHRLAGNAVVMGTDASGESVPPAITKKQLARYIPLSVVR